MNKEYEALMKENEKLKKDIVEVKNLCVYLAGCYQRNYDRFASSINYCSEVKKSVNEKVYKIIQVIFMNFVTAQGTEIRSLVEEIAHLEYECSYNCEDYRKLFGYDKVEIRKELYKIHFGESAKELKVNKIKKMWRDFL